MINFEKWSGLPNPVLNTEGEEKKMTWRDITEENEIHKEKLWISASNFHIRTNLKSRGYKGAAYK